SPSFITALPQLPTPTHFPYTTLFRSTKFRLILTIASLASALAIWLPNGVSADELKEAKVTQVIQDVKVLPSNASPRPAAVNDNVDRKSTRLNSSHEWISYAVFCLKKK